MEAGIDDGSFGHKFPERCPDGPAVIDTNNRMFYTRLNAEVPEVIDPESRERGFFQLRSDEIPPTLAVLDLMQFCYHAIAKPKQTDFHSIFMYNG